MERLTKRSANGTGIYNTPSGDPVKWENNRHRVLQKLADYEDLEEQGLLLRLPCKVGDTVYAVTRDFVSAYTIHSIEKYNEGFFFTWKCVKGIYKNIRGFTEFEIGKTVFLTKEEADEALRKMKESTDSY